MVNVRVEVYSVNYTDNAVVQSALIERSQSLKEYSQFIYQLQQGKRKGQPLEEALCNAMDYCIENDIMRGFLETHGSEVRHMLYTEWNMEEACRIACEEASEKAREKALVEGRMEGRIEGEKRERLKNIRLLKDVLSPEVIAEKFGLSLSEVLDILEIEPVPKQS